MAAILLHRILFLFTSWARIGLRAPPLLYHFDQGTPLNDINDVTREKMGRDMGFGHFAKLPQRKSKFGQNL